MVMETKDHCVKNATASQLPTTIVVATKYTTEKNVMRAFAKAHRLPLLRRLGNVLGIKKNLTVKCADLQHNILISLMCITLMAT